MKKRCFVILTVITLILSVIIGYDAREAVVYAEVDITSDAAVVMEGSTGTVIYEKNKDKELIPASITKIMTLILIFEAIDSGKISLNDTVTVSEYAASMGGSQVFLEPNETQTVDTMIKCISIASANDACVAMAEHIAGSEEAFVDMMNEKASELGMEHTCFLNCNGLDDDIDSDHFSSAYDVALMSRELITKHPQISKYSTTWMDTITHVNKKGEESEFGLTNTNKLIRSYNGITGLKTGSTSKAKYCLSATAKRDGMDMIAVVMAAPDHKTRFTEAAKLLDYGFANCQLYTDDHKDFICEPIPVKGSMIKEIEYAPVRSFSYVFTDNEDITQIKKEIRVPDVVAAPVSENDIVGSVEYSYNEKIIGNVNLVSKTNAPRASYTDHLFKLITDYISFRYCS